MEERLQKVIANHGIASRRKAEEMIRDGQVTVNGRKAIVGMKVDPTKDHIKIKNKLITGPEFQIYLMFHKPAGCITSMNDPEGRLTVKDYLRRIHHRVYPVGRLDYHSEGLLLLTNDGDFANKILHPKNEIKKTYLVKVSGIIDDDTIKKLKKGIKLQDGLAVPSSVKKVKKAETNSWVEIVISEGRKRLVKRMFQKVGYTVRKLKRIRIGNLYLGELPAGHYRYLTKKEIKAIIGEK